MRPSELEGKKVITPGAKKIGIVAGITIDCSEWKVTHLRIELTDKIVEILGYRKPFLGHVEILLPVDVVKAVADIITLDKKVDELRGIIEPPKRHPRK
jgi:sporulation protein YlmC with PRC-barrel domain